MNNPTESTLYVRKDGEKLLIIVHYVDDLLITGPNEKEIADFKADLGKLFEITSLGNIHYYLSIQFITVGGGEGFFLGNESTSKSSYNDSGFKSSYQDNGEPTDVLYTSKL